MNFISSVSLDLSSGPVVFLPRVFLMQIPVKMPNTGTQQSFVMMRLGSGGSEQWDHNKATINETLDMDPWAARDSVSFGQLAGTWLVTVTGCGGLPG